MSATLVTNVGELTTLDPDARVLAGAAVVMDRGRIAWIGHPRQAPAVDTVYAAGGRAALPGWVDSHPHLMFAGARAAE
ncbi:MAG: imidazolonepropionase, partial [Micrococcaceae bacterium]|nr:imidazolonepropionase [Micrococcaceae bacterium]